jgi:hypothetical protein
MVNKHILLSQFQKLPEVGLYSDLLLLSVCIDRETMINKIKQKRFAAFNKVGPGDLGSYMAQYRQPKLLPM